jgi:hypothetical protein
VIAGKTSIKVCAVFTAISRLILSIIAFLVSTEDCAGWLGLGVEDDEPPPKNDMTKQQSSKTFLIAGIKFPIFLINPRLDVHNLVVVGFSLAINPTGSTVDDRLRVWAVD